MAGRRLVGTRDDGGYSSRVCGMMICDQETSALLSEGWRADWALRAVQVPGARKQ